MSVKLAWVNTAQNTGPFIASSPDIPDAAIDEVKKVFPGSNAVAGRDSIRFMLQELRAECVQKNLATGTAAAKAAVVTAEQNVAAALETAWPSSAV